MSFELPDNWHWLPFEKLFSEPLRNGIYKQKEFHGRGCKIINMGELFAHPRLKDGVEMKRVELNEREFEKSTLKNGDLIFARRSLTAEGAGKCSIILSLDEPTTFESSIIRVRLNQEIANPEYYYYLFNSPFGKWLLGTILRQVAVSGITGSDLAKLEVPVPPKNIQNELVVVGRNLDDKITLNTQTNQTLEAMAQALFKSWFVDFDPVKEKMRDEQAVGMDAGDLSIDSLPKEVAALFPDKLVESDLGLIPEGWTVSETKHLFDVKDGTHDSPKKSEQGHYLVTSKHITKGRIDTSKAYLISNKDYEKVNQRSKVESMDILLSMIGTVGEIVVVYDNPVGFAIKNVGLFKTSQRPELVWFFFWHLQSVAMKHHLQVRMAGTTQQYLTLKTLRAIPVLLPSPTILTRFNSIISPIMNKVHNANEENKRLEALRDTLLPKLLSGELRL